MTGISDDDRRYLQIAWRLGHLRWLPGDELAETVMRDGRCLWAYTEGEPPQLTGIDSADRELAARLCAECPVQDECLEFELRAAGEQTTGVWGALGEDDRKALYPHWRQFRQQTEDQDGGPCSWPG